MINGRYDILHPGDIACLQQTAKLGARLIVAVNDNASVARLKEPSRPLNHLERRMAVKAALRVVDWFGAFGEDTPERLSCGIKRDYLVKGSDFRPEDIASADCVREAGSEVQILPIVSAHSTTQLIHALLKHQRDLKYRS